MDVIQVFLSEWIFRHGYYHGHGMDTSSPGNKPKDGLYTISGKKGIALS